MAAEVKHRKKKKLGSYPYISVVFSITLALLVLGLFGLLLSTTSALTRVIQENVEMQVYLTKGVSEVEKTKINKTLASKPFILQSENQTEAIRFISKEEAAKEFIQETGEDFMKFLGENPLKDAFAIKIDPAFHDTTQMQAIQQEIEAIRGVFEVVYTNNMVQSINENLTKISLGLLVVALILVLAIIILINNTIKLALFSQRFLIRSMQLVGATSGFIRKPFLYRAITHGLISGLIASALLYGLIQYGEQNIDGLGTLQSTERLLIIFGILLVTGMLIAFFSTWRAIKKYLGMSLDELY